MRITIASDHAGYELRQKVIAHLNECGYTDILDGGALSADTPYSYVEAGQKIAEDILEGRADRGIAICGTGIGISIVVNKFKGIRCGLCNNEYMARMLRQHNDGNVLAFGARVVGQNIAFAMVDDFLNEPFAGERHAVRVNDIRAQEDKNFK